MSYRLLFTEKAQNDAREHQKAGDRATLKKIKAILEELAEHPETGTGKVEQLKYELAGCWSGRINREHRIVYNIDNDAEVVTIFEMKSHYRR